MNNLKEILPTNIPEIKEKIGWISEFSLSNSFWLFVGIVWGIIILFGLYVGIFISISVFKNLNPNPMIKAIQILFIWIVILAGIMLFCGLIYALGYGAECLNLANHKNTTQLNDYGLKWIHQLQMLNPTMNKDELYKWAIEYLGINK